MRIVLISDTHCAVHKVRIPDCDLLIHSGDWTYRGTVNEVETFAQDLAEKPGTKKIVIAGNHDFLAERDPHRTREIFRAWGINYLQDEGIEYEGLKIWGSPWQPRFMDWAFNLDRGPDLAAKWAHIPEGTDILITHGPPFTILDSLPDGQRIGCEDLLARVKEVRPRLHVFGHIHHSYGIMEREGTVFVNASIMDEEYEPVNAPHTLELNSGKPIEKV